MRWIQIFGLNKPLYRGRRTATVRYLKLTRYLPTLALLLVAAPAPAQQAAPVAGTFETAVLPIFNAHCADCHGPESRSGGLHLLTRDDLVRGGQSGAAIRAGNASASMLMHQLERGKMPPEGPPLTPQQLTTIRRWIDVGGRRSGEDAETARQQIAALSISEQEVFVNVFFTNCLDCHGKWKQEAGLDLRTRASLLKGGKSGPGIVPGDPASSLVYQRILADEMPPPKNLFGDQQYVSRVRLQDREALRQWIAAGALSPHPIPRRKDPVLSKERLSHWAFQPPQHPRVPKVKHAQQVRTPIDAFLLAHLEAHGTHFSPPADPLVLLRRAALTLTGLPPALKDTRALLSQPAQHSYETLLDRLLTSPQYGEHQALWWLDGAGYADTHGQINRDELRPFMWRYRDYVVRAFNEDKPYDQFLTEQLAGDELFAWKTDEPLTAKQIDSLVATGFLRTASDATDEGSFNKIINRFGVINEQLEIVTSSIMGLTLECARCHSHKFDPIPQEDYYRFAAIFRPALDPYDWRIPNVVLYPPRYPVPARYSRDLFQPSDRPTPIVERYNAQFETPIIALRNNIAELQEQLKDKALAQRLANLPRLVAHYRFEHSGQEILNAVTGLSEGTQTARLSKDAPRITGVPNRTSLDLAEGGLAVISQRPFLFHRGAASGDATLEFFLKTVSPTDQYGSVFWTASPDIDGDGKPDPAAGAGQIGDQNRFNVDLKTAVKTASLSGDFREVDGTGPHKIIESPRALPKATWVHVAIVRRKLTADSYRFDWYFDGQLDATQSSITSAPFPDSVAWTIGGRPGFPVGILIDEIRMWDGALWASELYRHGAARLVPTTPQVAARLLLALQQPEGERSTDDQRQLRELRNQIDKFDADASIAPLRARIKALEDQKIRDLRIHGLADTGGLPTPVYVFKRGEIQQPGRKVDAGTPVAIHLGLKPFRVAKPTFGQTSGRRLALARWLTQPNHPLTARVIVNRVWQQHFGRGLVDTPGNFGRIGAAPSHPQLLDWLATEFVRNGWSIRQLHKQIMMSTAWRQASQVSELSDADPDNRLLSRFPFRRLTAEAMRDSILSISGQLDPTTLGPPVERSVQPNGEVRHLPGPHGHRRSLYLIRRRKTPNTMLTLFDTPAMVPNCLARTDSTVPTQALQLFNSEFVRTAAARFAERLRTTGNDRDNHIETAYRLAFGRDPTPAERNRDKTALTELTSHWEKQLKRDQDANKHAQLARQRALENYCHILFNTPELIYVD